MGWMKNLSGNAEGLTEYPSGPFLEQLSQIFKESGSFLLLLDVSGSMIGDLPEAIKGCTNLIREAADGGYATGVILWSDQVEGQADPEESPDRALRLLSKATVVGGTTLKPALESAQRVMSRRDDDDRVVAIFTDGGVWDINECEPIADQMKAEGIRILTLDVSGASINSKTGLGCLASPEEDTQTAQARGVTPANGQFAREGMSNARVATRATMRESLEGFARGLRLRR